MKVTEEQFTDLIRQNEERLRNLCRIYASGEGAAKDIYQEIVIRVWRSLPTFNGDASIHTWIYRLALNTAISHVRKVKTRRHYRQQYRREQRPGDRYHGPAEDHGNERVVTLYNAISNLNPSEKAIIMMYLEDFSYAEIAFVTDITENYVGVKLNRIKKKLSKMIGGQHGT